MPRQPDESDPDDDVIFVPLAVEPDERVDGDVDAVVDEFLLPPDVVPPPHCPWRFFSFSAFELGADTGALGFGFADLGTGTRVGL